MTQQWCEARDCYHTGEHRPLSSRLPRPRLYRRYWQVRRHADSVYVLGHCEHLLQVEAVGGMAKMLFFVHHQQHE